MRVRGIVLSLCVAAGLALLVGIYSVVEDPSLEDSSLEGAQVQAAEAGSQPGSGGAPLAGEEKSALDRRAVPSASRATPVSTPSKGSLTVRVVAPDGRGVAGFGVSVAAYGTSHEVLRGRTDEDGEWRAVLAAPAVLDVRLADGSTREVVLARSEDLLERFSCDHTFPLTVVAMDTLGRHLADAEVHYLPPGISSRHEAAVCLGRTQADGTFVLDAASPTGMVAVRVDGCAASAWRFIARPVASDGSARVRFVLQPGGCALRGRVVDERGAAMPGVAIEVVSRAKQLEHVYDGKGIREVWQRVHTETGDDGMFRLFGLPAGQQRVAAQATGMCVAEADVVISEGAEGAVSLVLREGAKVEGTVRDKAGKPVVGARVVANSAMLFGVDAAPILTDDDGHYLLAGVPEGKTRIAVIAPAMLEACHEIDVFAPMTSLDVTLQASHAIKGVVLDEHGVAQEGVRITLLDADSRAPLAVPVMTAADGRFRLEASSAEKYCIACTCPGSCIPNHTQDVAQGATDVDIRIPLAVAASGVLEGRLVCEGIAAPGVALLLEMNEPIRAVGRIGASGGDGNFRVRSLPSGSYAIVARWGMRKGEARRFGQFWVSPGQALEVGALEIPSAKLGK